MKKLFTKYWGLIFVVILSFWSIKPILGLGFFPMHDDTQVARVFEMGKALKDGMFPVRWVSDLGYGYGYPIFNFYGPLSYYVGGLINALGVDALNSTKAMMVIGILLSGIFMYLLTREFWGEDGAVVSSLFYIYAPYHALDIYVRGAVGEFWAMAFIPLAFYGLWKSYQEPKWKWVIIGALGYAGIITSHNLIAMMVAPFILITTLLHYYIAFKKKKLSAIRYPLSAIFLGLGLSAFYWMPALLEMGYTNVLSQIGGGANFRDHFVCWQQLWDSPWGFGGSGPGCIEGMSFKIGKLHIIVSLIAFIASLFFWRKDKPRVTIILLFIIYYLSSIFMMLEISKPVWEAIPVLAFIQYPWRFLAIISFSSAFLAGAIVWFSKSLKVALVLIILLLYFNAKLFEPQKTFSVTANDYTNKESLTWTTSKISDEYMPKEFLKAKERNMVVKKRVNRGEIIIDKTQELSFITQGIQDEKILINIAPFPSWKLSIDGWDTSYTPKNDGIEVPIPAGKHQIRLYFASTSTEILANVITFISGLTLIGGILLRKVK